MFLARPWLLGDITQQKASAGGSFQVVQSAALNANDGPYSNYNFRSWIDSSNISHGGSQVRVRFVPDAILTGDAVYDAVWIGHSAGGGNPERFDGSQVQLLFSGSGTLNLTGAGSAVVSDAVTFALDNTKGLLIAMHVAVGTYFFRIGTGLSGVAIYFLSGASTAPNSNPGAMGAASNLYAVDQIEAFY